MTWPRERTTRDVLPSEKGLLELAGRQADMSLRDILVCFRDLVSADMDWTDSRKARFRFRASLSKVAALLLTAASTIVLGIPAIPARASFALPMVAAVTVLSALETFFNWCSRWVLMEEAQYRLNRLRDAMDYYLVATRTTELTGARLDEFFKEQQEIWSDVSRRWIEFRKLDREPAGEHPPELRANP